VVIASSSLRNIAFSRWCAAAALGFLVRVGPASSSRVRWHRSMVCCEASELQGLPQHNAQEHADTGVQVVDTGSARGKILVMSEGRHCSDGQVVLVDRGLITMRAGIHFDVARGPNGKTLGLRHRNYGQAVIDGFYALSPADRTLLKDLFCMSAPSRYLKSEFGETGARLAEKLQIPPEGSLEEAWLVLRTFNCNAQTLFHPQTGDIESLAVYPLHARINHSCSPNVVNQIGSNGCLEVCALQPLGPGDELCHSYVDEQELSQPGIQRRAKLQRAWGFECRCSRCEMEDLVVRSNTAAADGVAPLPVKGGDAASMQFEIPLSKPTDASLGVKVLFNDTRPDFGIGISEVLLSGAVAEWNASAPQGRCLQAGDRIIAVNGAHGVADMVHSLQADGPLRLLIQRG